MKKLVTLTIAFVISFILALALGIYSPASANIGFNITSISGSGQLSQCENDAFCCWGTVTWDRGRNSTDQAYFQDRNGSCPTGHGLGSVSPRYASGGPLTHYWVSGSLWF
jgi:hypothetical protein